MSRLLKSNVFYLSVVLQLFSVFVFFISLFVVILRANECVSDFAQGRCLVGGRYTPFLMIEAISRKKERRQDSQTKTITFGIKNGPCETRPCSSPFSFPFLFLFLSFFLSFFFPFSFPIRSYFFPFPFPFLFLSLSYSFFSLPLLFLFLLPFLAHVNPLVKVWSQRLEKR